MVVRTEIEGCVMSAAKHVIAGAIDTVPERRFSVGPTDEVVLSWWDHTVTCSVLRERADHQVIVREDVTVRWAWHIVIAAACAVVVLLIALMAGLPLLYSLFMAVLLGAIVMGLIVYERTISADRLDTIYRDATKIDGETMLLMDEPVWEDIKAVVAHAYANGLRDTRAQTAKLPAWLQRLRPMSSRVMDTVLRELHAQCDPVTLQEYHAVLEARYRESKDMTLAMGTGLRGCTCRACTVREDKGWDDAAMIIPGSAASARRKQYRIAVGEDAVVDHGVSAARTKAKAAVAEYEAQREQERLAEIEAERKRDAREYVAQRRGKTRRRS